MFGNSVFQLSVIGHRIVGLSGNSQSDILINIYFDPYLSENWLPANLKSGNRNPINWLTGNELSESPKFS